MGRSRGSFGTKAHVSCNALGNSCRLHLGQCPDLRQAQGLLEENMHQIMIADKNYKSGSSFATAVAEQSTKVVIPSRSNAKRPQQMNKNLYKD